MANETTAKIFATVENAIRIVFAELLLVIALGLSPVWMTFLFIFDGEDLTELLYKDTKKKAVWSRWYYMALKISRPFWYLLGMSVGPKLTKWYFINNRSKELKEFSIKNQMLYYNLANDPSKERLLKRNEFSKGAIASIWESASSKERLFLIENLDVQPEFAKDLLSDDLLDALYKHCKEKEKSTLELRDILQTLCHSLSADDKRERTNLDCLIGAIPYNSWGISYLDEYTKDYLWTLPWHGKLALVIQTGITRDQFSSLLRSKQYDILREYTQRKTLSANLVKDLISFAGESKDNNAALLLRDIIIKDNLSTELMMHVYKQSNTELTSLVEEAIDIYTDVNTLCTYSYQNLSPTQSASRNHARWKLFFEHKKNISTLAQQKLSFEQYQLFRETGHRLDKSIVEDMLISLKEREYFKAILKDEWDNLTPRLINLFKTTPWKHQIYMEMASKN
ncbi:MAG: hypothetical protein E7005_03560 [Alphaproteobacteria bacterium]|nr:hypothetical protein [Alphaproteobacteria bacterium]